MKFVYEYRTSDNKLRTGIVFASDREAAYVELRSQGIRPARLSDAPGFFNKLFGRGKRWIAIGVLLAVVIALMFFIHGALQRIEALDAPVAGTLSRRQIVGDSAVIAAGVWTGWRDHLGSRGDRLLAAFAQPGIPVREKIDRTQGAEDLLLAMNDSLPVAREDPSEVRQLKRIIEGMKCELREYVAEGGDTEGYLDRLVERQNREFQIRDERAKRLDATIRMGADREQCLKLWKESNAELKARGIKTIAAPEELFEAGLDI